MPAAPSSLLARDLVQSATLSHSNTSGLRLVTSQPPSPTRPHLPEAAAVARPVHRLPAEAGLGVLNAACPAELVDRVLAHCGRQERRRRLLPARLVVVLVVALCLFPWASYEECL